MSTKTEIAAAIDDYDLTALAERCDTAHAEWAPVNRRVRQLTDQLQHARQRDAEAAAVAIETGKKIPEPTETKIRLELDGLARQREALQLVMQRAELDWQAVVGQHTDTIRAVFAAKAAAARQQLDDALDSFTAALDAINDAHRYHRWAGEIDRFTDPGYHGMERWPTSPSDSTLNLSLFGGNQASGDDLVASIRAALAAVYSDAGIADLDTAA